MRIYGQEIDIQTSGVNANISLSFSRANMFAFGLTVPRCEVHNPTLLAAADYCCAYSAVIAGGVTLPMMSVRVSSLSQKNASFAIQTAANDDTPIYSLFNQLLTCGCCRPITPAAVNALRSKFDIYAIPNYSDLTACTFGGYAQACLFYEPHAACYMQGGQTYALCRDCYGIVCGVDRCQTVDYIVNFCGCTARAADWQLNNIQGHLINVNDYSFAWRWRDFIAAASCWWFCNCGAPLTGIPTLCPDTWVVFPNTRTEYYCSPWPACEWAAECGTCCYWTNVQPFYRHSGCITYCYTACNCRYIEAPNYANIKIAAAVCGCCGDYYLICGLNPRKMIGFIVDVNGGGGVCSKGSYCCEMDVSSVFAVITRYGGALTDLTAYKCGIAEASNKCVIFFDIGAGVGNVFPLTGNCFFMCAPQGACLYAFIARDDITEYGTATTESSSKCYSEYFRGGGWTTINGNTDTMAYGCMCLPGVVNFFGCGIIDTICRVSITMGCYMSGTEIYSPRTDTITINCAVDYCVFHCEKFLCGYTTDPDPCYISCNVGAGGATPLLSQIVACEANSYPLCRMVALDPITGIWNCNAIAHYENSTMLTCLHTHGNLMINPILSGYCATSFSPSGGKVETVPYNRILLDIGCRKEVGLMRGIITEATPSIYTPIVCGVYGRPFAAVDLCYYFPLSLCADMEYLCEYYGLCGNYYCYIVPGVQYSYDIECGCEVGGPYPTAFYRDICQPTRQSTFNAVLLTLQPSDAISVISRGVGACILWNNARWMVERIDNYNPTACTCLKVLGIMV